MAEANYNQVMSKIKTLNLSDQLRLLEEMATLIRKKTSETKPRSILVLKGRKGNILYSGVDLRKRLKEKMRLYGESEYGLR